MTDMFEQYTTPPPLRHVPNFIREIRELVEQTEGVAHAVAETFERANVTIAVNGPQGEWKSEGQGALLIGDHRHGIEYGPLLAMLGGLGREDAGFIAKPFCMQARIIGALTASAGITLPVIPGTLARDRTPAPIPTFDGDMYWRMVCKGNLPTRSELHDLNADTLQRSTDLISSGKAVVLYPSGGATDAVKEPWHRGVGRIIEGLSSEAQDTTTIVPFRFDDFSRLRLIHSLVRASRGKKTRPQTLTLQLGKQGTVRELLGSTGVSPDSATITETLRQQFITSFADLES